MIDGEPQDNTQELTDFERAFLDALRVSPPAVKRAMAPYLLRMRRCRHGNGALDCARCLLSLSTGA